MKRRDFLKSIFGATVALPLTGLFDSERAPKPVSGLIATNVETYETTGLFSDITVNNDDTVIYSGWYDDEKMRITCIKRIRDGVEIENLDGLDIPYARNTGSGVHFY